MANNQFFGSLHQPMYPLRKGIELHINFSSEDKSKDETKDEFYIQLTLENKPQAGKGTNSVTSKGLPVLKVIVDSKKCDAAEFNSPGALFRWVTKSNKAYDRNKKSVENPDVGDTINVERQQNPKASASK